MYQSTVEIQPPINLWHKLYRICPARNWDIVLEYQNSPLVFWDTLRNRQFTQFTRTSVTVTLTLDDLDLELWHTIVYHSSTSTYTPNFIETGKKSFCGPDVHTDGRKDIETGFLVQLRGVELINNLRLNDIINNNDHIPSFIKAATH